MPRPPAADPKDAPVADAGATLTEVSPAQAEVEKIIKAAKQEGSITAADLAEKLSVLDLTPDDTDAVYQRLVELNVEVVEDEVIAEEEEEEEEAEEPAPDADEDRVRARREVDMALKAPTNDPVRMYLKQMGQVPLLTRETAARAALPSRWAISAPDMRVSSVDAVTLPSSTRAVTRVVSWPMRKRPPSTRTSLVVVVARTS